MLSKNGKGITKLTFLKEDKVEIMKSFFSFLSNDISLDV